MKITELLLAAASRAGAALVLSTHDLAVAGRFPVRWTMADGRMDAEVGAS